MAIFSDYFGVVIIDNVTGNARLNNGINRASVWTINYSEQSYNSGIIEENIII